jgi:hypothetical protein
LPHPLINPLIVADVRELEHMESATELGHLQSPHFWLSKPKDHPGVSLEWLRLTAKYRDRVGHLKTSTDDRAVHSHLKPLSGKKKFPTISSGNPHVCLKIHNKDLRLYLPVGGKFIVM